MQGRYVVSVEGKHLWRNMVTAAPQTIAAHIRRQLQGSEEVNVKPCTSDISHLIEQGGEITSTSRAQSYGLTREEAHPQCVCHRCRDRICQVAQPGKR